MLNKIEKRLLEIEKKLNERGFNLAYNFNETEVEIEISWSGFQEQDCSEAYSIPIEDFFNSFGEQVFWRAESFDLDDWIDSYAPNRGKYRIPSSYMELVRAAEDYQESLNEINKIITYFVKRANNENKRKREKGNG